MPICERCNAETEADEIREHLGQSVCEDCYMDLLNPPKSCDPWAVYTATRLKDGQMLTPNQEKILEVVRKHGELSREDLLSETGFEENVLQREFATLRHMEILRGEKKDDGSVVIKAFHD